MWTHQSWPIAGQCHVAAAWDPFSNHRSNVLAVGALQGVAAVGESLQSGSRPFLVPESLYNSPPWWASGTAAAEFVQAHILRACQRQFQLGELLKLRNPDFGFRRKPPPQCLYLEQYIAFTSSA